MFCIQYFSMFCGLVIIIKNLNSINIRRPWPPLLISHFSAWPFLVLGHYFLHPGCLWLEIFKWVLMVHIIECSIRIYLFSAKYLHILPIFTWNYTKFNGNVANIRAICEVKLDKEKNTNLYRGKIFTLLIFSRSPQN